MAKKIIILDRVSNKDANYRYVLWASVPSGVESYYANAEFSSAYAEVSGGELTALRAGTVVEQVGYTSDLPGSADPSFDDLLSRLVVQFNEFQSRITTFNPYEHYEKYFDGTTWIDQ